MLAVSLPLELLSGSGSAHHLCRHGPCPGKKRTEFPCLLVVASPEMSPAQWVVSQLEPCMLVCSLLLLAPQLCCLLQEALLGAPSAAPHAWGRPRGKSETLNNLAVASSSFLNSDAVCFVVFWLIFYGRAFAVLGLWKKPAGGHVTGTMAGSSRAELDGGARAGRGLHPLPVP